MNYRFSKIHYFDYSIKLHLLWKWWGWGLQLQYILLVNFTICHFEKWHDLKWSHDKWSLYCQVFDLCQLDTSKNHGSRPCVNVFSKKCHRFGCFVPGLNVCSLMTLIDRVPGKLMLGISNKMILEFNYQNF